MFIYELLEAEFDEVVGGQGTPPPPPPPAPTTTQTPIGTIVTCPSGTTLSLNIQGNTVTAECVPNQ